MSEVERRPFSPAVIALAHNTAGPLPGVLERVSALGVTVFVVDDGTTDGSAEILARWAAAGAGRIVLKHPQSRGRAAALRTGFEAAWAAGHSHAATIDTDGTYVADDLLPLIDAARAHPESLVLGVRSTGSAPAQAPGPTARRISNLLIRMESGARVTDSRSTMRVYPLGLVRSVRTHAGRAGFEAEILTRAAWAECPIVEVPISQNRSAPLATAPRRRAVADGLREAAVHARLIGRAILPLAHRPWPGPHARDPRPWWKRVWAWLNPVRFWTQLHQDPESRPTAAAGFALGVFLANTPPPLYGLHVPVGLYLARRLNFHPLPVVAGCALAAPPLGLLLVTAEVALGARVINGHWPHLNELRPREGHFWEWAWQVLPEWWTGAMIVGITMAVLAFLLVKLLLAGMRVTPPERSGDDGAPEHASEPDRAEEGMSITKDAWEPAGRAGAGAGPRAG